MSDISIREKYVFKYPGIRTLIDARIRFYNAGDNFYYSVWTDKNSILLSVSSDDAASFKGPKEILQISGQLVDIQFVAIKEKFAMAITEKAPDSTTVRAAYGNFDVTTSTINSQECPKRHVFPQGTVLNVQLLFVDYEKGITEEHVFVQKDDEEVEEDTGRHP